MSRLETRPRVVGSAARFAARSGASLRARRRRTAGRVALLVAVLAALVALAWVVWFSPLLGVRDVRVIGARAVPPARVAALVQVPPGTPLARVDTGAVARRVQSLPLVASVSVSRRLPGTLVVRVEERLPVAVLRAGGGWQLLDRDARPYLAVARRPRALPVVEAANPTPETLRAAVAVVFALPAPLRRSVVSVSAPGPNAIGLRLTGGRSVVWGGPDQSAKKAAVLAPLLQQKAAVYDVSAPDLPTTRQRR